MATPDHHRNKSPGTLKRAEAVERKPWESTVQKPDGALQRLGDLTTKWLVGGNVLIQVPVDPRTMEAVVRVPLDKLHLVLEAMRNTEYDHLSVRKRGGEI